MKSHHWITHTLPIYIVLIGMLGCGGCGGVKNTLSPDEKEIKKNTPSNHEIEPPQNVNNSSRNELHPHPDSIALWNERTFDRIKRNTVQPDADTKYFTINPESGEVKGCPLLKFAGLYDYKADSIIYANENNKFKKLIPKMEKAWLGTKDISPSVEFPEGEEQYPRHGYFSANDEYIVVPDGHSHGGTVDRVYFFNKKGELVNKFMLGNHLNSPTFGFNKEKTFFILSNGVGPEYYFFYPDGRVFKKGEFKEEGTSYGDYNISTTGKYWILMNNLTYVYSDNELILKLNVGGNTLIDESSNLLYYTIGSEINILNLQSKKILFKCNQWLPNEIGLFENGKLYFNISTKRLTYETVKI